MSEENNTNATADADADADAGASTTTSTTSTKTTTLQPLFETLKENDNAMLSFADGFRDKVKILFDHFDKDKDGNLNYYELAALQKATATNDDTTLCSNMYIMACKSLNCHPDKGLSLEALKFTYAADGSDIDVDYDKVFDAETGEPKVVVAATAAAATKKDETTKDDDDDEDKVYEVGADGGGVDISASS